MDKALSNGPNDKEPVYDKNKTFRWVSFRVFKKNIAKTENKKLKLKPGDSYTTTFDKFISILEKLADRKKNLEYYAITHFQGQENEHYHGVICCDPKSEITFGCLKNLFPFSYIYGVKYGARNAIQYLVHQNSPDKEPYSWDMIVTNAEEKLESWKTPTAETPKEKIKKIVNDIVEGNLKEYEIATKIEPGIYIRYNNRIKTAFEYRRRIDLLNPNRKLKCIVLFGNPGVGKTTFAKAYAQKYGKSICFSSSSNDFMECYKGEQVFVLDDFNFEKFSIEDFLKLLDPNTQSTVRSRYHNKLLTAEVLFIATNIEISDWYFDSPDILRKAMYRRISDVFAFGDLKPDGTVDYTVNAIAQTDKWEEEYNDSGILEHRYRKVSLVPRDPDKMYTFDLNKYISLPRDDNSSNSLVNQLVQL